MAQSLLLQLTPTAADKILELRGDDPTKEYLRIYLAAQGCCNTRYGMAFVDDHAADDELVEVDSITFVVDPVSRDWVIGAEIDFVESQQGTGFTVTSPRVLSGSGCACNR